MSLTATAQRIGKGLKQEVDVNGRHVLVTDEPLSIGGTDSGPAPHELLPAMLASCVSTMVSLYAQKRNWDLGQLAVKVDYDFDSNPRRCQVTLELPPGLSKDQVKRLERVAKACPVRRAFEAGFEFEERTIISDPVTVND